MYTGTCIDLIVMLGFGVLVIDRVLGFPLLISLVVPGPVVW